MSSRKVYLSLTLAALFLLFSELVFRVALCLFGYPFFLPARYLEKKYYPFIEPMEQAVVERGGDTRNILILGGSVVNTHWSRLELRLDTLFQKAYPDVKKFNFFNVAMPGHNSRDNLVKYNLLKNQHYDLVIYYEAINENRANNISSDLFYPDYSHIKWYDEINLLLKHPEMNVTVMPYAVHYLFKSLKDKLAHRNYISNEQVDPNYAVYGKDIKTAGPYHDNINAIASLANKKHDRLLLVKYASYFPKGVTLTGEPVDKKYFTPCYIVSPVTTWGKPEHVVKGIGVHNQMLEKVYHDQKTYFFDMSTAMPKDSAMFCDVCHLSEPGAQRFAKALSSFVVSNKLIR
ncbi:hypothetical protein [Dyadobacter fanqingshengii]|uniref:SGNH/GDSL hydrolase family protein n=1 Tax=Dyadobacter fanqingshengii TaxID=2906443 RepID=A0A9X1TB89_9BACT|nr:hypothetical protein [Dyadobacter fanqingshengii]MCF0043355.1 hypothetical protein [Dyadobacter fanqingshengii]USJ35827.1 hypothetical protein NFI81_24445 [Dyadobacter fanqingshengii]